MPVEADLLHDAAQRLKRRRGLADNILDFAHHRNERAFGHHAHAKRRQRRPEPGHIVHASPESVRIDVVGAAHHDQGQGDVAHRPCDGADVHPAGHDLRPRAGERDQAVRRLVTDDVAVVGRQPIRASEIGPDAERRESRRYRCRLAPAGTARRAIEVPGVERPAKQVVHRLCRQSELRAVRLPDDDCPGLLQSSHGGGVGLRDSVGIQ